MRNPILASSNNRAQLIQAVTTLITQLPIQLPNATIPINGVSMTTAQIVTLLEKYLTALQQIAVLRGQLHNAIVAADDLGVTVKGATGNVETYVGLNFGETSDQYTALGFSPRKPADKTVEVKAEAAEKSRATRVARGTKGKRQRAGIHGEPATSPPEPSSPAIKEEPKPNKP